MIKVLVVVYGLVLFVPDGPPGSDPRGVTALALDSSAWQDLHEHVPAIDQHGGTSADVPLGDDFQVVFRTAKPGSITLTALPHLARVDELANSRVRRECLEPGGSCEDLLRGRFRFEGLWRTRPASRCLEWQLPLDYRDQAVYDFRPQKNLNSSGGTARRLATALIFEADVQDLDDVAVVVSSGDTPRTLKLSTSESGVCRAFINSNVPDCVVIEVANAAVTEPDEACRQEDPPQYCRADPHFAAFYDLLMSPPAEASRRIPYVTDNYTLCDTEKGIGNVPTIRCPPTLALPAEEESP